MSRTFTAAVHREDDWYVAQCLEVDVCSQGASIDEALHCPTFRFGRFSVRLS